MLYDRYTKPYNNLKNNNNDYQAILDILTPGFHGVCHFFGKDDFGKNVQLFFPHGNRKEEEDLSIFDLFSDMLKSDYSSFKI